MSAPKTRKQPGVATPRSVESLIVDAQRCLKRVQVALSSRTSVTIDELRDDVATCLKRIAKRTNEITEEREAERARDYAAEDDAMAFSGDLETMDGIDVTLDGDVVRSE